MTRWLLYRQTFTDTLVATLLQRESLVWLMIEISDKKLVICIFVTDIQCELRFRDCKASTMRRIPATTRLYTRTR